MPNQPPSSSNNRNDIDAYSFLWDKWKHHDDLLYSFTSSFWTVQSVSFVIIPFIGQINALYGILFLIFMGYINIVYFKKNLVLARNIRNTFNLRLVDILIEKNILGEELRSCFSTWKPENSFHPVNLWHTPHPFRRKNRFVSSSSFETLIVLVTFVEVLVAVTWLLVSSKLFAD